MTSVDEFSQRIRTMAAVWAGRVLQEARESQAGSSDSRQVEHALLMPALLRLGPASLEVAASTQALLTQSLLGLAGLARDPQATRLGGGVEVPDMLGHRREVYYPFALHLHLQAMRQFSVSGSVIQPAFHAAVREALIPVQTVLEDAHQPVPPAAVGAALWACLCLHEAVSLGWRHARACDPASDSASLVLTIDALVQQVTASPGPEGSLHVRGAEVHSMPGHTVSCRACMP